MNRGYPYFAPPESYEIRLISLDASGHPVFGPGGAFHHYRSLVNLQVMDKKTGLWHHSSRIIPTDNWRFLIAPYTTETKQMLDENTEDNERPLPIMRDVDFWIVISLIQSIIIALILFLKFVKG